MSKIKLKKELSEMSQDQLLQIILEAYDSRKEIKEYFEFFLNPDIDTVARKTKTAIEKELNRVRRYYSKARVTVVKKLLAVFAGYKPTPELMLEVMIETLAMIARVEYNFNISEALYKFSQNLTSEIVGLANENELAKETVERINMMVNSFKVSNYFRRLVLNQLNSR